MLSANDRACLGCRKSSSDDSGVHCSVDWWLLLSISKLLGLKSGNAMKASDRLEVGGKDSSTARRGATRAGRQMSY